jgi:hypothetical protein
MNPALDLEASNFYIQQKEKTWRVIGRELWEQQCWLSLRFSWLESLSQLGGGPSSAPKLER